MFNRPSIPVSGSLPAPLSLSFATTNKFRVSKIISDIARKRWGNGGDSLALVANTSAAVWDIITDTNVIPAPAGYSVSNTAPYFPGVSTFLRLQNSGPSGIYVARTRAPIIPAPFHASHGRFFFNQTGGTKNVFCLGVVNSTNTVHVFGCVNTVAQTAYIEVLTGGVTTTLGSVSISGSFIGSDLFPFDVDVTIQGNAVTLFIDGIPQTCVDIKSTLDLRAPATWGALASGFALYFDTTSSYVAQYNDIYDLQFGLSGYPGTSAFWVIEDQTGKQLQDNQGNLWVTVDWSGWGAAGDAGGIAWTTGVGTFNPQTGELVEKSRVFANISGLVTAGHSMSSIYNTVTGQWIVTRQVDDTTSGYSQVWIATTYANLEAGLHVIPASAWTNLNTVLSLQTAADPAIWFDSSSTFHIALTGTTSASATYNAVRHFTLTPGTWTNVSQVGSAFFGSAGNYEPEGVRHINIGGNDFVLCVEYPTPYSVSDWPVLSAANNSYQGLLTADAVPAIGHPCMFEDCRDGSTFFGIVTMDSVVWNKGFLPPDAYGNTIQLQATASAAGYDFSAVQTWATTAQRNITVIESSS